MPAADGRRRATRVRALAVCPPGLEEIVGSELSAIGIQTQPPTRGGVPFGGSMRQVYAATARLRAASTVLVRLATFEAFSFVDLEREAKRIDWSAWLGDGVHPRFRVSSTASALFHTDAIAERLHGVCGVGPAPHRVVPAEEQHDDIAAVGDTPPEQPFTVRLVHDRVTISVDAAGEPLHRRGWRLATAKAPLRPTLAAGALAAMGYDGSTPMLDPMCGSGTIAIEAALAARRIAPGLQRHLALKAWPCFEPGTWASMAGEARSLERRDDEPLAPIVAGDRDAGAVAATIANAERAGVAGDVIVRQTALSAWTPPDRVRSGIIVTNPPWGHRVEASGDLRNLYAAFGSLLDGALSRWQAAVITDQVTVAGWAGRHGHVLWKAPSGGIPVTLLRLDPRRTSHR